MFDFITNDSFDINKTKQYNLSIQVSLDGFSFLVIHPVEKKIVACKNMPVQISSEKLIARHLKEWVETESLFLNPFNKVFVYFFSEKFTLIPNEFYSEEHTADLVSSLFGADTDSVILANNIESVNARIYFPVMNEITGMLYYYFPRAIYIHPVTNILQIPFPSEKLNQSALITFKKNFYLVVKKNNKLLLANSFQFSHPNDLIYIILNTFQQLETSRSETELFISGLFSERTSVTGLLKPYFENITSYRTDELVVNPDFSENRLLLYLSQSF